MMKLLPKFRSWLCTPVFLLFFLFSAKAQDTIVVHFGCADATFGSQVCIPVLVDNFIDVTTFSILLTWDPTVLQFVSITNENFSNAASNLPGPSDLRYIWSDLSGNGHDLPDGSTLFEVCFDVIGPPTSSSIFNAPAFVLNPFNSTEFANPDAEAIPFVSEPCVVDIVNPLTVGALITSCGSPDGIANGSFTITAAGGMAPYTYTWAGPVNGSGSLASPGASAVESVPPGNYTITITDNTGANRVYMFTVAFNALNPLITIIREVTCYEFSNGRVEVASLDGDFPVEVLWENTSNPVYNGSGFLDNSGDTYLLNSLPVGNYVITLIDANGCMVQRNVDLQAEPIVIDVIVTDAMCFGIDDGSAEISFSGGRPFAGGIYEVSSSWGGGTAQTPSPVGTPPILAAGEHWVEVCDSINGCCVRDTFEVGAQVEITAGLLVEPPTCAGLNNGRVRVTGLTDGGVAGPYDIQIFNASHVPLGPPVNNVILVQYTNLAPGNYFVVIREGLCRSDTLPVTIPTVDPITIELISVQPSGCLVGQGTGAIEVLASGGTPDYTYVWDGGAFTGDSITGVDAGTHVVTVTDDNGCTRQLVVMVPMGQEPVIDTIIASNIGCTADSVTLEVVYTLGSAPIDVIDWSTGDTTAIITGVGPGIVTVLIRDEQFCFDIASFEVPSMAMMSLDSIEIKNPTCIGDEDGHFAVFVSQGLEPYTYIWSTGDTTTFNLLPGLGAGTYSVTVLDADTCNLFVDTLVQLAEPEVPDFAFSAITATSCFDSCNGSAILIPSGGLPGVPYTFYWNSGLIEVGMQSSATELCGGYENVIITQDSLCFYEDSVLIDAPDPSGIDTLDLQHVSCFGSGDGLISVLGSGGTGPYTYTWDVLPAGPVQVQLEAGIYSLTISDSQGCEFEQSIQIIEPDSLALAIDSSGLHPVSCNSANSGTITVVATGGTGGYDYAWNPGVSTSFIATGVSAGDYSITVTDENGCTATTFISMTGPSPVISSLAEVLDPLCFGGLTPVTVESATGGNGGFTWSVNGGEQHPLMEFVDLPAGIYQIIIQDSTGCRDTVDILIQNPLPLEIEILPDAPIIGLGDSIQLEVHVQGMQINIDSVLWVSNGPLSCNDCPSPVVMNVVPTVYSVTVWDENGCSATVEVLVEVDNTREVFIPNVFSPNFDGHNDDFVLFVGQGITDIPSAQIFDRWGELVIEHHNLPLQQGGIAVWDGTFEGELMQPGVYVYFVKVRFANGEVLHYRGDVTLLR